MRAGHDDDDRNDRDDRVYAHDHDPYLYLYLSPSSPSSPPSLMMVSTPSSSPSHRSHSASPASPPPSPAVEWATLGTSLRASSRRAHAASPRVLDLAHEDRSRRSAASQPRRNAGCRTCGSSRRGGGCVASHARVISISSRVLADSPARADVLLTALPVSHADSPDSQLIR